MKIENSANVKSWRVCETRKTESSQDLYLACISFLVLLFVAVADTALKM